MEILFLGTAAAEGWPGIFCECEYCEKARELKSKNIRTRSSIIIDRKYKVDLPPDTYWHTVKYGLNLSKIEHLFITHSHADHFDFSELYFYFEPFAHFKNKERYLNIYGNKNVFEIISNLIKEKKNGQFIIPHLLEVFKKYEAGDMEFYPVLADHEPKETSLNFIFKYKNRTILHGYDTGWYPDNTWEFIKDFKFDIVIMDCTNGILDFEKYHLGIKGVIKVKEKLLKYGCLKEKFRFVATHFSHNGKLLYSELEKIFKKEKIEVAYDGKKIKLRDLI